MRVGTLDLGQSQVKYIGDVHLGRRFTNGVPLHRRGERETMILNQFQRELLDVGQANAVVQVGDVFDRFAVSNNDEMDAFQAIKAAAETNPHVRYFFLRGNHDASKDLEKVSSFDILVGLCAELVNVDFIVGHGEAFMIDNTAIALIPWHPVISAADMVPTLADSGPFAVVFGHWDIQSYGGDDSNLIPIQELSDITDLAVTGHDHKPRKLGLSGHDGGIIRFDHGDARLRVIGTGSMQPYAHGEEADFEIDPLYLTETLEQVEYCRSLQPEFFKDKCLRILLQPSEVLPDDLDCLQLTAKRVGAEGEDENLDVELGEFNMEALFSKEFETAGVRPDIAAIFKAKFLEVRAS
jgi:hypothetical protein